MAATPALSMLFLLVAVLALLPRGSSSAAAQGPSSTWCVCNPELPAAALQRTLDYACGHGADCAPLQPGGLCHTDTDTVAVRCSYAANSYYSNANANGGGGATCDFGGTATLTSTDPSSGTCKYPAVASVAASASSAASTTVLPFLLAIIAVSFIGLFSCTAM